MDSAAATWTARGARLIGAVGIVLCLVAPVRAELAKLATESYTIPAADPGIQLYVRNKHPADATAFPAEKILLFVHGATYPAEAAFDLTLNGLLMMDYIARQGPRLTNAPCKRFVELGALALSE